VNIMVKLCYNMPLLMDRPMLLLPLALLLLPPACESWEQSASCRCEQRGTTAPRAAMHVAAM